MAAYDAAASNRPGQRFAIRQVVLIEENMVFRFERG